MGPSGAPGRAGRAARDYVAAGAARRVFSARPPILSAAPDGFATLVTNVTTGIDSTRTAEGGFRRHPASSIMKGVAHGFGRARSDAEQLAEFGYKQELHRTLGSFSSFAAGFSYISILTGMFQTSYLGFLFAGPAFIWAWLVVLFGQMMVALQFAELVGSLSAGRIRLPVVEAGRRQGMGMEHGVDVPVRPDRHRSGGCAGVAGDPAPDLDQVPGLQVHSSATCPDPSFPLFNNPAFAKNAILLGIIMISSRPSST